MDTLQEKVKLVEAVFARLDEEIARFQATSGLHCKAGCGKCCFKSDIEATPLEFLPFAWYLYQNNLAEEWLEKVRDTESPLCVILNPTQAGAGLCSEYVYRGLICRLFGYSARTNKYGKPELITCQIIKTEQAIPVAAVETRLGNGLSIPVMNQYYMQLASVDFDMAREFYPINAAIRRAIETVMQYYVYR
jgi:Fe-S-cluster containining protein